MEVNLSFVLFEELRDKPDGGAEAHMVILRESKRVDSALDSTSAYFDLLE